MQEFCGDIRQALKQTTGKRLASFEHQRALFLGPGRQQLNREFFGCVYELPDFPNSVFFDEPKSVGQSAGAFYFLSGVLTDCMNLDVQMGGRLIAINQRIGEAIDSDPKPDVFVSGILFYEESLELIKVRRLLAEH